MENLKIIEAVFQCVYCREMRKNTQAFLYSKIIIEYPKIKCNCKSNTWDISEINIKKAIIEEQ
jgi:hypothetical protein